MNEEVLLLEIDDHCYGVRVAHVREVLRAVALSPVPSADDLAEGVLNLRGRSVPVINMRRRFGLIDRVMEPSDYLIVLRIGPQLSAIRVDRAIGLMPIDSALIEPVDTNITSHRAVVGIIKVDARVVFLIDPQKLLTGPESKLLGQLDAANGPKESLS